jgi:PAS domain S-box-containing protein
VKPGPHVRVIRGWFLRSAAVLAEVGIAFFLREMVAHRQPDFAPFITFYPAVLLASLLDGVWAGIAVTVLATVVSEIWIFAPIGRLAVTDAYDVLSLAIFFSFGISLSIVVELYHRNREKLAMYLVEEAVAHEREKQEAERKLTESVKSERQRLFDVMEALPVMVSLRRPDHQISFANRAFRENFGDPTGRHCYEVRFARSSACEDCDIFLPLETGEPRQREVLLPDNTIVEAHEFPFADLDGSSQILEMGIDITERRQAETELKRHREHLEELVAERTRQVEAANAQLAAEIRRLEQAKQELSESRAKLEAALSSMTDSVLIVDTEGRFVQFNDAYYTLYRFRARAECSRNFSEFMDAFELYTESGEPVERADFPTWRALRGESGSNVEYRYKRKDTGESWIGSLSFSPVRAEDGSITGAVITARDVTGRKRAEVELAEARLQAERSATQLRTIFDSVEERLYVCDSDGNCIMANGVTRKTYGDAALAPSVAEMVNLLEVFDMEGRQLPLAEWPISRALRGEHVHAEEIRVKFKSSNEERILSSNGSAIRDESGNILMVVLTSTDITERKRTEEALRLGEKIAAQREQFQALAERLRQAREEERTRISRDLHDQIAQILTAMKFDLTWMKRHLPKGTEELRQRLQGVLEQVGEGMRSVHKICNGLRPGVLDDLGLAAAVEWEANEFASKTGIDCAISVPPVDVTLHRDQATEFFRVFQECLTNITHHAEATTVRVALHEEAGDLVLEVADDGKGFDESEIGESLGLLGMKERAQVCGGNLAIDSNPGSGTVVTLRVPMRPTQLTETDYAHFDHR